MLKYAFICDMPGAIPEKQYETYEAEDCFNLIVGTPNMATTEKLVKHLSDEGFTAMNFCGAFNDENIELLKSQVKNDVKMSCVKYLPKEQEKMNELQSLKEFGIIIEGTETLTKRCIKSDSCNVYTYFIKDMEMAKEAATKLVEEGVDFIEMCGWFKESMTKEIITAIKGAVPVGSAGI